MATKLEGGGGKTLVTWPLKKNTFFATSLIYVKDALTYERF